MTLSYIVFRTAAILSFFATCTLLCGCIGGRDQNANSRTQSTTNSGNQNSSAARSNVEELGLLVKIPYETEDVVWKEVSPSKKVVAVLLFPKATADKVVADAQTHGAGQNVTLAAEPWFPDELIAQSEMSGDAALRGTAYPGNAFFLDKYNAGTITRIEGSDHFVLEITAR